LEYFISNTLIAFGLGGSLILIIFNFSDLMKILQEGNKKDAIEKAEKALSK
jgi:hypothetical protein